MSDKQKILVIGSGPIVIGQAAEFDYAGTQACKALREEGLETVLVNSNPATIMTDLDVADSVYIEPLTIEVIERIIIKEMPDAILPTLGGQTGLNLAVELFDKGILGKYNVDLLGTPIEAIKTAEDRAAFNRLLGEIGEPLSSSLTAVSWDDALYALKELGLPLVIRPAYTLGGTGGGLARTEEEFERIAKEGLAASPIHQILVERSLEGWREIEYEVMRDAADNCITVCNMENMDPMGVHTGDSIVVAPSQTLTDKEYQMLRSASMRIIRALGIEGGCNVQFALRPHPIVASSFHNDWIPEHPYYVIEVNPRVSRSSALASKATGYPIARVAAKLAVGKRLDEIPNAVTKRTSAAFEPALDYCVVKIPRWPFDKFPDGDRNLSTQMKATGEVMAIERSFEAALQKAVRSLEIEGRNLLWENGDWINDGKFVAWEFIKGATDFRLWALMAALRRDVSPEELSRISGIDVWFLSALRRIVDMERSLLNRNLTPQLLRECKRKGFTDEQIGTLSDVLPAKVRELRKNWGITPVYKMVDTCAAEFEAATPYFYSTYDSENEALPLKGNKTVVIGSGPIRIGQGIEFDYCSVHAAWALRDENIQSIMVNSNPETVSTDFDTSDRLYFEPLDQESLLDVIENEEINNVSPPTIVQFGGQTALNLSQEIHRAGHPILGSSAEAIDIASDRGRFDEFLSLLDIPQPPGASVRSQKEALMVAENITYPVVVRPSYVLGGRAMEVIYSSDELEKYLSGNATFTSERSILVDHYMEGKECEVDAICDGDSVLIPGIMEHIERAGVHSGDSISIYPGINLTEREVTTIVDYTTRIGLALGVKGLMNVQFVIVGGPPYRSPNQPREETSDTTVYVLEVNLRSSRTVPFLSKVTGIPMVNLATRVVLGKKLTELGYGEGLWPKRKLVAVKAPVFSMSKLIGVDWYLGPEMKSTGEVMGIDYDFNSALLKALMASNMTLVPNAAVLVSVADRDKYDAGKLVAKLLEAGCSIYATEGTASMINDMGEKVTLITKKLDQGYPNVVDVIREGIVSAVINTVSDSAKTRRDGFYIRRAAAEQRIPCYTSLDTAHVAAESLLIGSQKFNVESIDKYLNMES